VHISESIQCTNLSEVESSDLVYESIYVYNVLLYRNEKNNVMYEITDKCLNCGILVKIEVLNFMILYFKFSRLPSSLIYCLFSFKFCYNRVLHVSKRFDKIEK